MPDVLNLPPRKPTSVRRKILYLLIFFLVVGLAFMIYLYNQAQQVSNYLQTAFTHYNQGLKDVNGLIKAVDEEQNYPLGNGKKRLNDFKKQIKTAEENFTKANKYFNLLANTALTDTELIVARLSKEAVAFNLKGLKQADKWLTKLEPEQTKLNLAEQGRDKILHAFSLANEATSLINKRQYDLAKAKLTEAATETVAGELKWQQLFTLTKDERANQIVSGIGKLKEWLQLLQSLTAVASQKNIAAYNGIKQKKSALDDEVIGLVRNENLINLNNWVDESLKKDSKRSLNLFNRAEKAKLKAVDLWEKQF